MKDPFFVKGHGSESQFLQKVQGTKKQKSQKIDAALRKLTKEEIKKLPGQEAAFPGRPILKDHYH